MQYLAGSPYYLEDVLGINLAQRAAAGKLTHLLLNQPPVCNYHCRRCFMPSNRRDKKCNSLSLREYCDVIESARQLGMMCMEISGEGEPLLARDLRSIIQCAHAQGMITTLITNGFHLTEELVNFFYSHGVTLVISLFSLDPPQYEMDNGIPHSFAKIMSSIKMASAVYSRGRTCQDGHVIDRMAVHTTAQADNWDQLDRIAEFCNKCGIFFSVAPLAPIGGGAVHSECILSEESSRRVASRGHNSIILSRTSTEDYGREVCGTCCYGLNIGYDGSLLFDAHAGYEVGSSLGNVREHPLSELVRRQRTLAQLLFSNITGFCPIRDPKWTEFLKHVLQLGVSFEDTALASRA